jgi:type II secretory pathway pseudopilin PulG
MVIPRRRRRAFRLIELILAVACVAILLGLVLPLLHRTKRTAINAECANNLKMIVLGSHTYAIVYGNALPPLTSDIARGKSDAYNGGILFSILPYNDSLSLSQFDTLKTTRPAATWAAHIREEPPGTPELQARPIKCYLCPADDTVTRGLAASQVTPPDTWAASSYAANYQVFGTVNDLSSTGTPTPGWGNYCGPKYNIGNIPDGVSNTIFFGEQFAACGPAAGNLWAYPGIGNYSDATAYPVTPSGAMIVNTPTHSNSAAWAPVFANGHKIYGYTSGGRGGSIFEFNTQSPPRDSIELPYSPRAYWDAPPQDRATPAECDKSRLQSGHLSVAVLVGMGDGSVRAINGLVSQHSWYCAIVPDDGTAFDETW